MRPGSLLNVDMKTISKALTAKLKKNIFQQLFLQIKLLTLINDVLAKVDGWSLILLKYAKNKILGGGWVFSNHGYWKRFWFLGPRCSSYCIKEVLFWK